MESTFTDNFLLEIHESWKNKLPKDFDGDKGRELEKINNKMVQLLSKSSLLENIQKREFQKWVSTIIYPQKVSVEKTPDLYTLERICNQVEEMYKKANGLNEPDADSDSFCTLF